MPVSAAILRGSASLFVLIGRTPRLSDNRRECETIQTGLRRRAYELSAWSGMATAGRSPPWDREEAFVPNAARSLYAGTADISGAFKTFPRRALP